jgi:hypothetical protein
MPGHNQSRQRQANCAEEKKPGRPRRSSRRKQFHPPLQKNSAGNQQKAAGGQTRAGDPIGVGIVARRCQRGHDRLTPIIGMPRIKTCRQRQGAKKAYPQANQHHRRIGKSSHHPSFHALDDGMVPRRLMFGQIRMIFRDQSAGEEFQGLNHKWIRQNLRRANLPAALSPFRSGRFPGRRRGIAIPARHAASPPAAWFRRRAPRAG